MDESVPDSAWITRVGDFGEAFQQAGEVVEPDRRLVAELVKSRRDR
ncbi:hypothetical protein ACGFZP_16445 [Kitasatospora sp. NPDC048239]